MGPPLTPAPVRLARVPGPAGAALLLAGLAAGCAPARAGAALGDGMPAHWPAPVLAWEPGRLAAVLDVRLHVGATPPPWPAEAAVRPLFRRRAGEAGPLGAWWRLRVPPDRAPAILEALLERPEVLHAGFAAGPAPPPGDRAAPFDIDPPTPDLVPLQGHLAPAPQGVDADAARPFPGGLGEGVAVADVEYGWDPAHEDLGGPTDFAWGWDCACYRYHGNAVQGLIGAADDGFGTAGIAEEAERLLVSPWADEDDYALAEAIDAAAALLDPGDVLLVEQQVVAWGAFLPAEAEPAVYEAIRAAVDAGIVVVEPAGNFGVDLDDPVFEGLFDPDLRDSGAIVVGGAWPPDGEGTPRSAHPESNRGRRVDVQGWYEGLVAPTDPEYQPDLFFPETEAWPEGDPRQAYTSMFGGTSGASAVVAGVCAAIQGAALAVRGAPLSPGELRSLLRSTGTPQALPEEGLVGPQPDLARALRWGVLP